MEYMSIFCVLGFSISDISEEIQNSLEEADFAIIDIEETGEKVIGAAVYNFSVDGFYSKPMDEYLFDLANAKQKVVDLLSKLNLDRPIQVYKGLSS